VAGKFGAMAHIKVLGKRVPVPGSWLLRVPLGIALVIGGILGFLPVLGYWMIPVGLMVLSIDFPWVRRWRRRQTVRLGLWMHAAYPRFATKIGLTRLRQTRSARMQPAE
jgi:hypothetical protein